MFLGIIRCMSLDPSAVGASGGPAERSWSSKDCLLYALGVGAGLDELGWVPLLDETWLVADAGLLFGSASMLPLENAS